MCLKTKLRQVKYPSFLYWTTGTWICLIFQVYKTRMEFDCTRGFKFLFYNILKTATSTRTWPVLEMFPAVVCLVKYIWMSCFKGISCDILYMFFYSMTWMHLRTKRCLVNSFILFMRLHYLCAIDVKLLNGMTDHCVCNHWLYISWLKNSVRKKLFMAIQTLCTLHRLFNSSIF